MAGKSKEVYSYIEINKTKRAGFLMLFSIVFVLMTAAIAANRLQSGGWIQVVFPVLLIVLPITLYPEIERWVYRPWQEKAQKNERHYRN